MNKAERIEKAVTFEQEMKRKYRDLEVNGYRFVFCEDGLVCFQTGDYATGFKLVRCRPSEVEDGSLELMTRMGMTR